VPKLDAADVLSRARAHSAASFRARLACTSAGTCPVARNVATMRRITGVSVCATVPPLSASVHATTTRVATRWNTSLYDDV
jgi:hypothetical protein